MVMHARKIPRLDENYRDVAHADLMAKEKSLLSRTASKYADRKSSRYEDALDDRKKDSPKTFQGREDDAEKIKERRGYEGGGNREAKLKTHKHRDHKSDVHRLAERVCGNWSEHISKSGKRYFYNCQTEVSQWEKPDTWIKEDSSLTSTSSRGEDKTSNDGLYNSRTYDNYHSNCNSAAGRKSGGGRTRTDHHHQKYYPRDHHNNATLLKVDRRSGDLRLSSSKSPNKRGHPQRSGSEDDRGGGGRRREARREEEQEDKGGGGGGPVNNAHSQPVDFKACMQEDMDISPTDSPEHPSTQPPSTDTSRSSNNKHPSPFYHLSQSINNNSNNNCNRKNNILNDSSSKAKSDSLLRSSNEAVSNDVFAKEKNPVTLNNNNNNNTSNITTTDCNMSNTYTSTSSYINRAIFNDNTNDANNNYDNTSTDVTTTNNNYNDETIHPFNPSTTTTTLSSLPHKPPPSTPLSQKPPTSSTGGDSTVASKGEPSRQQQSLQTTLAGLQRAVLQLTPDGASNPVPSCKKSDSSQTSFASCVALLPVLLTQLSNQQQASNHSTNHENQLIIQQAIPLLKKLQEMVAHQQQQQQQRKLQTMLLQLLQMQKADKPSCPSPDQSQIKAEKAESPYSPPDSDGSPVSSPINKNNIKTKPAINAVRLPLLGKPPHSSSTPPQNLLSPHPHAKAKLERVEDGDGAMGAQDVCKNMLAYGDVHSKTSQIQTPNRLTPPPPSSSSSSSLLPSSFPSSSMSVSSSRPLDQTSFLDNIASLASHVNNKLTDHVSNWSTESFNKQANCYSMENQILYGSLCSQISPELKHARSMVRGQEILSTIHEQRVSSIRQQLFEVERGSSSSFLPPSIHPFPTQAPFQPPINHQLLQQQFIQQSFLQNQQSINQPSINQPLINHSNPPQINHSVLQINQQISQTTLPQFNHPTQTQFNHTTQIIQPTQTQTNQPTHINQPTQTQTNQPTHNNQPIQIQFNHPTPFNQPIHTQINIQPTPPQATPNHPPTMIDDERMIIETPHDPNITSDNKLIFNNNTTSPPLSSLTSLTSSLQPSSSTTTSSSTTSSSTSTSSTSSSSTTSLSLTNKVRSECESMTTTNNGHDNDT